MLIWYKKVGNYANEFENSYYVEKVFDYLLKFCRALFNRIQTIFTKTYYAKLNFWMVKKNLLFFKKLN